MKNKTIFFSHKRRDTPSAPFKVNSVLSPCSFGTVNWKSVIASKASVVPFPPQRCFTQKGCWFCSKPSEEVVWRWRQAGIQGLSSMNHSVPGVPRGNLLPHCLWELQRPPHIWSGAEIVMWSHGEEEAPCFADQNLQSNQKSRGSKFNWPEEQLWKYLSTQRVWESQGSGRLSRAIPLKYRATVTWAKAWKWTADKATVTATTCWYLRLNTH